MTRIQSVFSLNGSSQGLPLISPDINEYMKELIEEEKRQIENGNQILDDRFKVFDEAINTLKKSYVRGTLMGRAAVKAFRNIFEGKFKEVRYMINKGENLHVALDRFKSPDFLYELRPHIIVMAHYMWTPEGGEGKDKFFEKGFKPIWTLIKLDNPYKHLALSGVFPESEHIFKTTNMKLFVDANLRGK